MPVSTKSVFAILIAVTFLILAGCKSEGYHPSSSDVLSIKREFRGVWIPTVGNLAWPSQSGLNVATQKSELIALLDKAKELNCNVIIFQIRPSCDALYNSAIEPWSEYLTGTQGEAPSPYYDPLEFCIAEAHERGMELHAWFNPFRARYQKAMSAVADSHVTKLRPEWVRSYGDFLWLDPGEPEAQDYSLRVVLDVVSRYDIDAVHFDDYFYPYPIKDAKGKELDFPDDSTWKRLGETSGLSRNDWRRQNVDRFVQNVYRSIHDIKPHLKLGISPFGIWRPGQPSSIKGLDAYDKLYADARKWLQEGWCDYLAPQLYWPIDPPATSYSTLLDWWDAQNSSERHVFPGLNALKTENDWPVLEILRQLEINRSRPSAHGEILWSINAIVNVPALRGEMERHYYQESVLVPAYPWLDAGVPSTPLVELTQTETDSARLEFRNASGEAPWQWIVQSKESDRWRHWILPRDKTSLALDGAPELIAVRAVNRVGTLSAPVVFELHP